jgi:aminopeptidase YwaD
MRLAFFLFSIFYCSFLISDSFAQNIPYARDIVNTLTSKEFAGRGYVKDGNNKAARFIQQQFDSLRLKYFTKSYAQPFSFSVNTFPGNMEVVIDGRNLSPGGDFIVHPFSAGSNKSTFKIEQLKNYFSASVFNDHPKTCYAVLTDSMPESDRSHLFSDLIKGEIKSGALILLQPNKLTWSVAKDHYQIPVISVLQYNVPDSSEQIEITIEEKFIPEFKTQNILGYFRGVVQPDSFIVISAHYDHLGMMGSSVFFPGANDNASGVSMLLNLARYFSKKENQPSYSIAFIAFAGEEAGLMGSKFYTEHPLFPLSQIKFLVNLDLLGTGDDGMMVVNATEFPQQFHLLDSLNASRHYLSKLGQRGKAKNSDHFYFTERGVPSFFFYTMGGIQAYHDINDKAETLPFTEYEDVFRLIVDFVNAL